MAHQSADGATTAAAAADPNGQRASAMAHQPGAGAGAADPNGQRANAMAHQPAASTADAAANPNGQEGGDDGEAAMVDPFLALSESIRKRILSFLPLMSVIRMSSLSSGWRTEASSLGFHLTRNARSQPLAAFLGTIKRRGQGRHLFRFYLINDSDLMTHENFNQIVNYAGDCSAEDIGVSDSTSKRFCFHFHSTSRRLVHLSLTGVKVSSLLRYGDTTFPLLEVVEFNSVDINNNNLRRVVLACPGLRVLKLRHCDTISRINLAAAGAHLVSLKVSECARLAELRASTVQGLRSFHYSGGFLLSIHLPPAASFAQLCICLGCPRSSSHSLPQSVNWFDALPNLSNLTVLTICNYALRVVFTMCGAGQKARLSNLRGLRELQLLMFEMKTVNLNDIYAFLKTCHFTQLEKLFVQLPKSGSDSFMDALNEVGEDPSEEDLGRLKVVKITDFKWHCNEIELVNFLFRKARFLQKLLILVSPQSVSLEYDLLNLAQCPPNVRISFCADDSTVRPFHSDAFVKK